MALGDSTFRYSGERAGFYGEVLWSEAARPMLTQETGFPGVDPTEIEGLPVSTCLTARLPQGDPPPDRDAAGALSQREPRRVFSFLDDQGYDCDLYFTDAEEHTFKVVVKKLAKA